ncbi:YqzH family protein [Bacillus weihaiensis]|uniref:YqzH-like protein n=1 Tax=Bacillus weihaiensis TaxID=1547283 RepID=A0A1L3MQ96_9BACI|nr:YqzH family protein [Bacillus weihaiensis]APH04515.1 hypothetical protein A9C19_07005 [Bacillus weihaiensis]
MEEIFIDKMIKKSFLQYGRDLVETPLTKEEYTALRQRVINDRTEQTEWYEVVEDVVYSYVTNQE